MSRNASARLGELGGNVPAYDETLEWLYHLEVSRGWDLKLETVRAALERLDSPERRFGSLHVAGTNGKGSTAAMAHAVLTAAGVRTGLYTSPHLSDFRERIRVGDEWIGRDETIALVSEVRPLIEEGRLELTFFELATVIAFLHFARAGVEAAVVEVGLGGRLDATNVVLPRVAAVTTIALDHERFLGSTLAEIAAEKAGILKAGVPAVAGRIEGDASETIERIARERGAPLRRLGRDFRAEPGDDGFDWVGRRTIRGLRPALAGRFQVDNAAVALAALEDGGWLASIDDETVRRGLASVVWPGRLEVLSRDPLIVVDGAHNPAGAAVLAADLPSVVGDRRVRLVFGVLADKRWQDMVEALAPLAVEAIVTPVPERRSEDPVRVAEGFRRHLPTRVAASGREALDLALASAAPGEAVLVAGSLFLVGEVRDFWKKKTRLDRAAPR